jgi:protocatechuate 3,4-dioxygenase beta subunit
MNKFFLALLTAFILSPAALGQSHGSDVTGRVLDENGASVAGAVVTLDADSAAESRKTESGVDGSFRFEGVPVVLQE